MRPSSLAPTCSSSFASSDFCKLAHKSINEQIRCNTSIGSDGHLFSKQAKFCVFQIPHSTAATPTIIFIFRLFRNPFNQSVRQKFASLNPHFNPVATLTIFHTYLSNGHLKKMWLMLSSCPQNRQVFEQTPPLFNKTSLVRILSSGSAK